MKHHVLYQVLVVAVVPVAMAEPVYPEAFPLVTLESVKDQVILENLLLIGDVVEQKILLPEESAELDID